MDDVQSHESVTDLSTKLRSQSKLSAQLNCTYVVAGLRSDEVGIEAPAERPLREEDKPVCCVREWRSERHEHESH